MTECRQKPLTANEGCAKFGFFRIDYVLRKGSMLENLIHEECGVFGIFGAKQAAELTYLGLYALQHRGQEGAGIISSDGEFIFERPA